jgi:hypothetical protein
MTPQEQQMIDGLVERIRNTPVQDKDVDAERHLQQGLAGDPNALYILAQTVLVQQYGLQQAQAQLQQMQEALEEARQHVQQSGGGGFLSKIFGGGAASQPQQMPYQPVNNSGYANQGYAAPPYGGPACAPGYGQPAGYAPQGGGFLRSAMQTAAGVAMGAMAFESMESLFHGFGGGGYERPGESVVNNYYGEAGAGEHRVDDGNFYNPENDASRQDAGETSAQGFADTGSGSDPNGFVGPDQGDNSGFDDSGDGGFDGSDANMDDGGGSF